MVERLLKLSADIWPLLTKKEQESYATCQGNYHMIFVEAVAEFIDFDIETLSKEEFDELWNKLENL